MQDAAVAVVEHLDRRVQAQDHVEARLRARRAPGQDLELLARRDRVVEAGDVEALLAAQAQAVARVPRLELERQHAETRQVAAVDALEAFGDHRAHALQARALGRPVPAGPGAVLLSGEDDERRALGPIAFGRGEDRHLLAAGEVPREAALDAVQQLVADADVGEGAPLHHLVVAAAGAVAVEVAGGDAARLKVVRGRAADGDGPRRRDVIRGDAVGQLEQAARAGEGRDGCGRGRQVHEEAGLAHVGAVRGPVEAFAPGDRDGVPGFVGLVDAAVLRDEELGAQGRRRRRRDLRVAGPEIGEHHRLAVGADAQSLGGEIDIHPACQGVGDDQGRTGQVVGPGVGADPALEVPVAAEHRGDHQLPGLDLLHGGRRQRTAVADADRAAVAHGVELELLQVGRQPGGVQVARDHP